MVKLVCLGGTGGCDEQLTKRPFAREAPRISEREEVAAEDGDYRRSGWRSLLWRLFHAPQMTAWLTHRNALKSPHGFAKLETFSTYGKR